MASAEFSSEESQTLRKAYVVHRADVASLHAKSDDPEVWQAGMRLLELLDADAARAGHSRNDLFALWTYWLRMQDVIANAGDSASDRSAEVVAAAQAEIDRIAAIVTKLGGDPDAPSFGVRAEDANGGEGP